VSAKDRKVMGGEDERGNERRKRREAPGSSSRMTKGRGGKESQKRGGEIKREKAGTRPGPVKKKRAYGKSRTYGRGGGKRVPCPTEKKRDEGRG